MKIEPASPRVPRALVYGTDEQTARWLEEALQQAGYEVTWGTSIGDHATDLARSMSPDVILVDAAVSAGDGLSSVRQIMAGSSGPILVLTHGSDPLSIEAALEAGASGYLVKPCTPEQVASAIQVARTHYAQFRRYQETAAELHTAREALRTEHEADRLLLQEAGRQTLELREQLRQEREAARIVAENFLATPPPLPGVEIATGYEPATDVALIGGDFLDFIALDGNRLGVVIGDLCGHGLSAASHLAHARFMLRAYAVEDPEPARVVTRLNRALCHSTNSRVPFLTLVYGVVDVGSGTFTYCNAGHPLPVQYAPGWPDCRLLQPTGGLVGVVPAMVYGQTSVVLDPGSALLLFTDGVTEAATGNAMLGQEGVCELLMECAGCEADEIKDRILRRTREHAGGRLRDDVAIVVIKCSERADEAETG